MAGKSGGMRIGLRLKFTGWFSLITLVVMTIVSVLVGNDLKNTLTQQIKQRGLALARNLAASCVEPMQLPPEKTDRTLTMMLITKEYVQSGGGAAVRDRLFQRRSMGSQVLTYMKRLGREVPVEGVRNEGVLSAAAIDTTGSIVSCADAVLAGEQWLEQVGQPYRPEPDTGLLAPGEPFRIWDSRSRNGIFLVAVPIAPLAASTGSEPGTPPDPARPAQYYGAVYLAMSQGLVEVTVARAIANLLLVAIGLLLLGVGVGILFAAVLTNPIRLLEAGVRAIAEGNFSQRINLKRSDEIGELTDAFNEMAKGLEERELMRGAFSSYVSGDLLAEIIKNPEAMKVGGARRSATMLFSFFANHHELGALTEQIEPEAVVRIINDYLEVQARLVSEYKGYLDKFIGDEVLAVWGVPLETKDHAVSAVRCAVAIRKAITELNESRRKQDLLVTDISIGINTGNPVAGNMGSQGSKLDYTVIGADVNFAARLGGIPLHGGEIWVSATTYDLVKDIVEFKDKGKVKFKGIDEPQQVYEITGIKDAKPAVHPA